MNELHGNVRSHGSDGSGSVGRRIERIWLVVDIVGIVEFIDLIDLREMLLTRRARSGHRSGRATIVRSSQTCKT
jgi:hypothetical protein